MQSGISLTLPAEALKSSGDDFARLQLLTFRSSSFFIPSDHVPDQKIVMKQWVVTAVVQGRKISNLSEPVEIIFRNIEVCLRTLILFFSVVRSITKTCLFEYTESFTTKK